MLINGKEREKAWRLGIRDWARMTFGVEVPRPGVLFAASFSHDTVWGQKAHEVLLKVELEYVDHLLEEIKAKNVPGALVEFGIFEGPWINILFDASERIGLYRQ